MKFVKGLLVVLALTVIFLGICRVQDPELRNAEPISANVETQLVEATIDAEYNEGLCKTIVSARYGNVFTMVTFTGFEGFCVRLRHPGDKIAMYLNTMRDESGRIVSQWLNMGK